MEPERALPRTAKLSQGVKQSKLLEGSGPVRQRFRVTGLPAVFLFRRHLTEGALMAFRLKHRIIAKAESAARWPDECAFRLAAIEADIPVRLGKAQDAHEPSGALGRIGDPAGLERILDLLHGDLKIAAAVFERRPVSGLLPINVRQLPRPTEPVHP